MEVWKLIEEYDGIYAVSSQGRVANAITKKLLKPEIHTNGYVRVHLCKGGKVRPMYVHRLVACTFFDSDTARPFVNHKDGDKTNNHVDNLEWVTHSENMRHAVEVGLIRCEGMSVDQYDTSGNYIRTFKSIAEAARTVGVSTRGIWRCIHGTRKTSGGSIWRKRNQ